MTQQRDPATPPEWQRRSDRAEELVGKTAVSRPVAWLAVGALAAVIVLVPLVQFAGGEVDDALVAAARNAGAAASQLGADPGAANQSLIATARTLEDRLETSSPLVEKLLPAVRLLGWVALGSGSHDVVPGRDGWLFWRPDLEAVLGADPLSPAALARAARQGHNDRDPLPAIEAWRDDLAARGITLVVVLTPIKPELEWSRLSQGALEPKVDQPLRVAGLARFAEGLRLAQIDWIDATAVLASASAADVAAGAAGSWFLRSDTHWNPAAVELVASHLARHLAEQLTDVGEAWSPPRTVRRRVAGDGDLLRLLRLPATVIAAPEVVEVEAVQPSASTDGGRASVLLLGDSFAGVFSRPELGWGRGAGLAERLEIHLGRRVELVSVNAGGASGSRARLAAELAADPERLAGVEVVVWQFAARELATGSWPGIDLPAGE